MARPKDANSVQRIFACVARVWCVAGLVVRARARVSVTFVRALPGRCVAWHVSHIRAGAKVSVPAHRSLGAVFGWWSASARVMTAYPCMWRFGGCLAGSMARGRQYRQVVAVQGRRLAGRPFVRAVSVYC